MERAVVSTSLGCEGLAGSDNVHLLVRDDPIRFADAIIQLVRDEPQRHRISAEARRLVNERYSWNSIGHDLVQRYMTLIKGN